MTIADLALLLDPCNRKSCRGVSATLVIFRPGNPIDSGCIPMRKHKVFIAGPPKAGTTALYGYLITHPQ